MTHDELLRQMHDLNTAIDRRVDIVRDIIDEHGQPTGERIYRGSFHAPPDWQPPSIHHHEREEP